MNEAFLKQQKYSLVEEFPDAFGVAVHGVEEERETHTQDGASEEGGEDGLLLPLDLDRRARQEVGRDPDEGDAAWRENEFRPVFVSFVKLRCTSVVNNCYGKSKFRSHYVSTGLRHTI